MSVQPHQSPIADRVAESKGILDTHLIAFDRTPLDEYRFYPSNLEVDTINVSEIQINGSSVSASARIELKVDDYEYDPEADAINVIIEEDG